MNNLRGEGIIVKQEIMKYGDDQRVLFAQTSQCREDIDEGMKQ
jgi:hypothetical protein